MNRNFITAIIFIHFYYYSFCSIPFAEQFTEDDCLIKSVQKVTDDIIEKYFLDYQCIVFVEINNYKINVNWNITFVKLNILENDFIIEENSLGHSIEFGCKGFIVHTKISFQFLTLLEKEYRTTINRHVPRILFIPNEPVVDDEILDNLTNHSITKQIPDILLINIQSHINSSNGLYSQFEFITVNWIHGGSQLLAICFTSNCSITELDLYPNKIDNLQGKEIRITAVHYPPFSVIEGDNAPDGIDIRVCQEFMRMSNATWSLVTDKDRWGYVYANGSTAGFLGAVANARADLGCTSMFLWYEPFTLIQYTQSYIRSGITCLVPRAKLLPQWLLPKLPFKVLTWTVLITSTFISTAVMYLFHQVAHRYSGEKQKHTIGDYIVKTIGLLTSQTISHTEFRAPYRQLFTWFHIYYYLVAVCYSSGLSSIITIPRYGKQINTVQDLEDSSIKWGGLHGSWLNSIEKAEHLQKLVSNFQILNKSELLERLFTSDYAYAIERLPGGHFALSDYITEEGVENLVVMESDVYFENCVLVLPKLSPYIDKINMLVLRLISGGITYYWEYESVRIHLSHKLQMGVTHGKYYQRSGSSDPIVLKLLHLSGAFGMLVVGLTLSMLVFVMELVIHLFNNKLVKTT